MDTTCNIYSHTHTPTAEPVLVTFLHSVPVSAALSYAPLSDARVFRHGGRWELPPAPRLPNAALHAPAAPLHHRNCPYRLCLALLLCGAYTPAMVGGGDA